MARFCTSKIFPGLVLIFGLVLAVVFANTTPNNPSSTLSLLKDNLKVMNVPLSEWLQILATNITGFVAAQTLLTLTIFVAVSYLAGKGYRVFFTPYEYVCKIGDVGYILDGKKKSDVVNEVRRKRKAGHMPPIYPNGWIPLMPSRTLKKGDVKHISALGRDIAVYRGQNDEVYAVDAHCPHLGANMGIGGTVKDNCIRCPFHGWLFEGKDGKCVSIPYQDKEKSIPPQAKVKAWEVMDVNGMVMVWHDAEGREPSWFPEDMNETGWGKLSYHGMTEHTVCGHCEDISENGSDCSHLEYLHGPFMGSGSDLRYMDSKFWSWATHSWGGGWEQDPDQQHIGIMTIFHAFSFFGLPFEITKTVSKARQQGPCHVLLHFNFPFGKAMISFAVTPMEGLVQKVTQQIYASRYIPRFFAKFLLLAEYIQFERDIMVWNYKTYASKPVLVTEDKLISKHRRWYSQFYSENSPKYGEVKKDALDW